MLGQTDIADFALSPGMEASVASAKSVFGAGVIFLQMEFSPMISAFLRVEVGAACVALTVFKVVAGMVLICLFDEFPSCRLSR